MEFNHDAVIIIRLAFCVSFPSETCAWNDKCYSGGIHHDVAFNRGRPVRQRTDPRQDAFQ